MGDGGVGRGMKVGVECGGQGINVGMGYGGQEKKGHWLYQSQIAHRNGVDSAEGCEQKMAGFDVKSTSFQPLTPSWS